VAAAAAHSFVEACVIAPSRFTPPALVIGLDSITGLQTARVLARRGIPVVGVAAHREHPSCRTNVCRRIVIAPTSGERLIETLAGLQLAEDLVLFPCTDLSVLTLSDHRDALTPNCRVILPAPHTIELLLDKARFHEHAAARGWPVVTGQVLRTRRDAEQAAQVLRYPCVLKPAVKTVTWQAQTAAKVYRVSNTAELLGRYDVCRAWTDTLLVQEWIDGPDSDHLTCNAYFDRHARPYLTFVSQKLRQWPLEGGVGCLSQECRDDAVVAETARVFGDVGHHGLAYLEMKRDARSGRYVIIEPNVGRPTGRSAAADTAGVPLLYTQYCDALGWPLPPRTQQPFGHRRWVYLRQDMQSAARHLRRGTLTPAGWLRSLSGSRDAIVSWRDPRPLFADLRVWWGHRMPTSQPCHASWGSGALPCGARPTSSSDS
jgi:D-aspartate ligase